MKLNMTAEDKAHFLAVAAQARKDNADDFLKVSAIDVAVRCVERGEMDDLDHSILDLASLMSGGKGLPPLKGRRKPRTPKPKIRRGIGSY